MRVILALLALSLYLPSARCAFSDDFSSYANGSSGQPAWTPFLGEWSVQDGEYRQTGTDQYDQGASVDVKPEGRYTISVRTKSLGGPAGGGLFWNMQSRDNRAHSQMVRVDPDFVIWGYEDSDGVFQQTGISNTGVAAETWHTVAVAVDTALGKYNVLLDGRIIGRNAPLRYFSGFAGIQSSLANAFDDFRVRPATAAETDGLKVNEPFDVPQAVAVAPDGDIYVADRGHGLLIMSGKTGQVLSHGPRATDDKWEFRDPVALVFDDDRLYLLDRYKARVTVLRHDRTMIVDYSPQADPLDRPESYYVYDRAVSVAPMDDASGLAVLPGGRIVVVSPGRNEVAVLDRDGKRVAAFTEGLKQPEGVTVDPAGRILVADTGNARIVPMTLGPDGNLHAGTPIPASRNPRALAVNARGNIVHLGGLGSYEGGGAVREIDQHGRRVADFEGFSIGAIGQRGGIALHPDGSIYVADADNDRIVVIPPDFNEPRPHVEVDGTSALVTWQANPGTVHTALRYGTSKDPNTWRYPLDFQMSANTYPPERARRQRVRGLAPNTVYYYRVSSPIRTIPPTPWSKTYSFLTAPPKGQMQYITIRAIVAIYLKTDNKGKKFALDRAKLGDRIPRMMARAREFYWRNTGFKINLELDYTVIDDAEADIRDAIPPLEQVKKDIQASADFRGKKVADDDSVFALWAGPRYAADQPEAVGEVGGGGLTPYAYSAFSAEGMVAWLTVHEFHHQIDAYFDRAGYPEYWLNHPDATIHPGRYGQHFDANAFILRNWPENDWFWLPANGVGRVDLTADADGDGVPDADPRLPLDEARLGSSPAKRDTDGDGLDDRAEAMAGIFGSSNPRLADTDADGAKDPRDPWPLNPERQDRPRKPPTLDGVIMPGEWSLLSTLSGPYNGKTYLNWDESAIYIAAVLDAPATMEVDLDPGNDGIFTGGNVMLRASAMGPRRIADRLDIANGGAAHGIYRTSEGKTVIELAVPRDPAIGLMPGPGQTMGLAIRFTNGSDKWQSVFEPWRLWTFTTAP